MFFVQSKLLQLPEVLRNPNTLIQINSSRYPMFPVMTTQLTRHVFRRILYNELFSETRCWFHSPMRQCLRAHKIAKLPVVARRSLWGFSRKSPREQKPVDMDPGLGLMLELNQTLRMRTRPPSPADLARAFIDFFRHRQNYPTPLEELQAEHAFNTFLHLQRTYTEVGDFGLSSEDLRIALNALKNIPKNGHYKIYNLLSMALFEEIKERRDISPDVEDSKVPWSKHLTSFIQASSQYGDPFYARKLVEQYWDSDLKESNRLAWTQVLKGYARGGNTEGFIETIEIMQKHNVGFNSKDHQAIVVYFAKKGDLENTKKWYMYPIVNNGVPTSHTDRFVLKLCIRHSEFEWGEPIFKSMLAKNPDRRAWNVTFQWAAARGKGVDEIERMMKVMVRRNEENEIYVQPDIESINSLVELANSANDPYTAERYVALGERWGFQPNARTYLLQFEYRMKVGDLDGARVAYGRLRAEEVPEDADIPLINNLIVAMCNDKNLNYDAIMGLVEDLNERKARFEPETTAALSRLHLQREEMHDLIDLLNTHTFHYGMDQRTLVLSAFLDFIFARSNSTSRAWDAYSILRQIFSETDIDVRTLLMKEFFDRKRSDMACHVFGHMRQQQTKEERPNVNTYVSCLQGIATAKDGESLEMVHNMLKLDSQIDPNTRLYNALMLAHTACGMPRRSLDFWEDIIHSREGPTYSSIQIAFQACEAAPFGDQPARDIWARMKRFDLEITREIYAAYIGALAGNGLLMEAMGLVENAQVEVGCRVDVLM